MPKINILDSSVFNRIAAGEVVESPSSVVKELTENSIDAGATSINIEIKNGGIDYIRVADNGHGIESSEIKKAFLPHSTSKIANVADLDSIATLGFRGEALSSIASVAVVSMTSRKADKDLGARIEYNHGDFISEGECGCPVGTSVTVERLFEKIPARRKFLKKPSAEESDISNLVSRLILANPDISFKYTANGKKIYQSDGGGIESAVKTVYGADSLNGLQKIGLSLPDFKLTGYVSKPSYSKHNRSFQTLIVNGRYVVNDEISYLVFTCLREFLMTRRYPMFVFYITLPFDMVDVNVHPKKMEVKFVQTKRILSLINQAIDAELFSLVSAPASFEDGKSRTASIDAPQTQKEKTEQFFIETIKIDTLKLAAGEGSLKKTKAPDGTQREEREGQPELSIIKINRQKMPQKAAEKPFKNIINSHFDDIENAEKPSYITNSDVAYSKKTSDNKKTTENLIPLFEPIKKIGTLFNTYIVLEIGECAYLIDQHAAHERILYNKFIHSIAEGGVARQPMLFPYTFTVSHSDKTVLDERLDGLFDCGFEIRNSGGLNYSIYSVPILTVGMNLDTFVSRLFEKSATEVSQLDIIKENIIQSACKSAVKQGDNLTDSEIDSLLSLMSKTDELYCPHGRPTVFRIDKADLEKLFKRIV